VGFELTISAGERPQTYALDCAAIGTGKWLILLSSKCNQSLNEFISDTLRLQQKEQTAQTTNIQAYVLFNFKRISNIFRSSLDHLQTETTDEYKRQGQALHYLLIYHEVFCYKKAEMVKSLYSRNIWYSLHVLYTRSTVTLH
jgi:inorganic triphosphatase YgiF